MEDYMSYYVFYLTSQAMCTHLNMMKCLIWNYGRPKEASLSKEKSVEILQDLEERINDSQLIYSHEVGTNA